MSLLYTKYHASVKMWIIDKDYDVIDDHVNFQWQLHGVLFAFVITIHLSSPGCWWLSTHFGGIYRRFLTL